MDRLFRMPLQRVVLATLLVGMVAQADAPPGRYQGTDLTVRDSRTTLSWQRKPHMLPLGWNLAVSHCNSLALDGETDWRLPTAAELESLTDVRRSDEPFLDRHAFPDDEGNDEAAVFWSSTEDPSDPNRAFVVGTGEDVGTVTRSKTTALAVRCVRVEP